MVCDHLNKLECELIDNHVEITYRGKSWSKNCREWVYFNCVFTDLKETIKRLNLDKRLVKVHSHLGTHSGQEYGLICIKCKDGIMGIHPKGDKKDKPSAYV